MNEASRFHSFDTKLRQGQVVERELDEYFRERYAIRKASYAEQHAGIDRVFTDAGTEERHTVEYKADWRAHDTGNVFIETVSVDSKDVRGWAYTSQAEWLVYALPQSRRYLLVLMSEMRAKLPCWAKYPKGSAKNKSYMTHGILVPLAEFAELAHAGGSYE